MQHGQYKISGMLDSKMLPLHIGLVQTQNLLMWIFRGRFIDLDLSDADLTGADLSGADLTGTDFSGATLTGTIFSNATYDTSTVMPMSFIPKIMK